MKSFRQIMERGGSGARRSWSMSRLRLLNRSNDGDEHQRHTSRDQNDDIEKQLEQICDEKTSTNDMRCDDTMKQSCEKKTRGDGDNVDNDNGNDEEEEDEEDDDGENEIAYTDTDDDEKSLTRNTSRLAIEKKLDVPASVLRSNVLRLYDEKIGKVLNAKSSSTLASSSNSPSSSSCSSIVKPNNFRNTSLLRPSYTKEYKNCAYVTLVMRDSSFCKGAEALAKSILFSNTRCTNLVCLVTPDITREARKRLEFYYSKIVTIEYVHLQCPPLISTNRDNVYGPWMDVAFTKLQCLRLFRDYKKIIYLDCDSLVLQNIDHLFDDLNVYDSLGKGQFFASFESCWSSELRKENMIVDNTHRQRVVPLNLADDSLNHTEVKLEKSMSRLIDRRRVNLKRLFGETRNNIEREGLFRQRKIFLESQRECNVLLCASFFAFTTSEKLWKSFEMLLRSTKISTMKRVTGEEGEDMSQNRKCTFYNGWDELALVDTLIAADYDVFNLSVHYCWIAGTFYALRNEPYVLTYYGSKKPWHTSLLCPSEYMDVYIWRYFYTMHRNLTQTLMPR